MKAFALKTIYQPYFSNCSKILDVGCGNGEFVKVVPGKIVGVEVNKQKVEACKQSGLNVELNTANGLPFKNSTFDGVYCSHVAQYVSNTTKFFNEIARVLKPSGVLVLLVSSESYFERCKGKLVNPTNFFNSLSLSRNIKHCGFDITFLGNFYKYFKGFSLALDLLGAKPILYIQNLLGTASSDLFLIAKKQDLAK